MIAETFKANRMPISVPVLVMMRLIPGDGGLNISSFGDTAGAIAALTALVETDGVGCVLTQLVTVLVVDYDGDIQDATREVLGYVLENSRRKLALEQQELLDMIEELKETG